MKGVRHGEFSKLNKLEKKSCKLKEQHMHNRQEGRRLPREGKLPSEYTKETTPWARGQHTMRMEARLGRKCEGPQETCRAVWTQFYGAARFAKHVPENPAVLGEGVTWYMPRGLDLRFPKD